jgi:NYN domain
LKSALFVDFDNVYSGLRKLDSTYADRFARQPLRWVEWMLGDLPAPEHAPDGARRRLLVRRVYLNPQVYQRYRAAFNHAGFEIIDCPAMTSEGKTSTDIHMVLDMIDLLQHQVHYDEFIVFSADADFTPVLRKLRRWDRRTTVLAVGFPSAAYRASADLLIDTDEFLRDALGVREADEGVPAAAVLPTAALASASAPSASIPSIASTLAVDEPAPALFSLATPATPSTPMPAQAVLVERIRTEVARADLPVPCARLASRLMAEYPGISPDWCGQGGFRRFLESLPLEPLALDWSASGGHLFDPARHALRQPSAPFAHRTAVDAASWGVEPAMLALIRQVNEITGVPLLSPRDFRALFDAVAAEVAQNPFQLNETGKAVRDRCRDAGREISRENVNWVLRGLLLCGHEFGQGHDDVPTLTYRLVGNLINLCRREQVMMDEGAPGALQRWMSGKVGE